MIGRVTLGSTDGDLRESQPLQVHRAHHERESGRDRTGKRYVPSSVAFQPQETIDAQHQIVPRAEERWRERALRFHPASHIGGSRETTGVHLGRARPGNDPLIARHLTLAIQRAQT